MNLEHFVAIGILGLFVGFRSRRFPIRTVLLITFVATGYFFWSLGRVHFWEFGWIASFYAPAYFTVAFIGAGIGQFLQSKSDDDKI